VHQSFISFSKQWALAFALSGLCCLAGCAGDGPPPGDGASSFDAIQQAIFNVSCVSGSCHSSITQAGGLVLEEGQSYERLVGVLPSNATARAAGLERVAPGNPERSFLLRKLTGPGAAEGGRMPQAAAPLVAADIERVRAWIVEGAPGPSLPTPTFSTPATPSQTPLATTTATATPTATPAGVATPTFSSESTLPRIQATIFDTTCAKVGCHNATDRAGGQSLAPGQAYAELVGVTPSNEAAVQDGFLRVDPGNPAESFLLTKLTLSAEFDPRYFSRMPLGKPSLGAAQIERIRAWILRGALPDETP
jgi:hypothetical protein